MRRIALALTLLTLVTAAAPLGAAAAESEGGLYELVFPVVGEATFTDTFGAARSGGRSHEGIDIMAEKMAPVVAVADGTVGWLGTSCCYFEILHDDGYSSWYIHLNNDTAGTDDGEGWGIADWIEPGVPVAAGQLIGWVGDSGNAEGTAPHLHFELRDPEGAALNPYESLLEATVVDEALPGGFTPPFWDDDESVHESAIVILAEAGVTKGCNPPVNDMYCPGRHISRGEIAAFLRRILELPAAEVDHFTDDDGGTFEDDINALATAGIAFGCTATEYCSNADLLRGEMAELLVRSFGYTNPDGNDYFTDDADHAFEDAINRLRDAGITIGCNPPDNTEFCPDRPLTRAEMATFLVRALDL